MNARIRTLLEELEMYFAAALTAERNGKLESAGQYLAAALWCEAEADDEVGEQERLRMELECVGRRFSVEEMLDMRE